MSNSLTSFSNRLQKTGKYNSELRQLKNHAGLRVPPQFTIEVFWPRKIIFHEGDYWNDKVKVTRHGKNVYDWTYAAAKRDSKITRATIHSMDSHGHRWTVTIQTTMLDENNVLTTDERTIFSTIIKAANPVNSALLRSAATGKRQAKIYFSSPLTTFET